jgi:glycogen debranching enzyme
VRQARLRARALGYNALCIAQDLAERFGHGAMAAQRRALAARAAQSFNEQFWNDAAGCLFDVIDEQSRDAAVRPNQILAVSLPYPILDATRHAPVLQRVCADLVTPFGVRSLAPAEPGYQGRYRGDIVSRDRAYHQGSAYPWLLGPLVSAHVRVHGRGEAARRQARSLVQGCLDYLCGDGLGQLPELFDGDSPHRPGGLPASALSVGEVLRAYVEDVLDQCPADLEAQRRRLLPVAMSVPARVP